jgi:hypothetical protein
MHEWEPYIYATPSDRESSRTYHQHFSHSAPHTVPPTIYPLPPRWVVEKAPPVKAIPTWYEGATPGQVNRTDFIRFVGALYLYVQPQLDERLWIRRNAMIPLLRTMRNDRLNYLGGIECLGRILVQTRWRHAIDSLPDVHEIRHYFYYYCHLFRFIGTESDKPQGFAHTCIHHEKAPDSRRELHVRKAKQPRNPYFTEEEDEMLYNAAFIFEMFGEEDLATILRTARNFQSFLAKEIRLLFQEGYLDPISAFSGDGFRQPFTMEAA